MQYLKDCTMCLFHLLQSERTLQHSFTHNSQFDKNEKPEGELFLGGLGSKYKKYKSKMSSFFVQKINNHLINLTLLFRW